MNTITILIMYEIFTYLLSHLLFLMNFLSTFTENLFKNTLYTAVSPTWLFSPLRFPLLSRVSSFLVSFFPPYPLPYMSVIEPLYKRHSLDRCTMGKMTMKLTHRVLSHSLLGSLFCLHRTVGGKASRLWKSTPRVHKHPKSPQSIYTVGGKASRCW